MLTRLTAWYWKRRERRAIAEIRFTLNIFGYDTSILTDDEIKARVEEFCEQMRIAWRKIGLSAQAAGASFARLADAFQRYSNAMERATIQSTTSPYDYGDDEEQL
jgi:hypothetical protein